MLLFFVLIIGIVAYQSKIYKKEQWNLKYMQQRDTNCIKGIFLFFVFGAHYLQYVNVSGKLDLPYIWVNRFLGQGIVTLFLFYSGYGIYYSLKNKGLKYAEQMSRKRIIPVAVHFWAALILYFILNTVLGKEYSLQKNLLAFTGWTSVGNSNWYIFAVFWCYVFTWIIFGVWKKAKKQGLILVTVLVLGYILVMCQKKPGERWWYNTVLVYPAGMWFSFYQEKIERFIKKRYAVLLPICMAGTIGLRLFTDNLCVYLFWSLLFAITVILLTMKISVGNSLLEWMGVHTFEIYILQRLPMIALKAMKLHRSSPYLFGIISLVSTFLLAWGFYYLLQWMDRKILKKL